MKKLFILTFSVLFFSCCANSDYDEDDSYSSSTSGNNSDSSNISDNATTFTVTVSYGKYYLDGVRTKSIKLKKGNTYYFDNLTSDDKVTNFDGIGLRARLDDGSRIVGTSLIKRENLSSIADAEYTPCLKEDYLIKNCPGWKLKSNKIYQNNDSNLFLL